MRNSIFLKTIAIILCAASLMGIIGSAAGVMLLTQNDLYNKTVEDMAAERARGDASSFATQIAYRYADQILGGCPVEISRYSSKNWLAQQYKNYGYAIFDAEGTVLESLNPELKDSTQTHTVPVTGQYMHLVSLRSDSQAMGEAAQKHLNAYGDSENASIPEEGVAISQVIFTDKDGQVIYEATTSGTAGSSTYYYRDHMLDNRVIDSFANSYTDHHMSRTGFLFHNTQRKLTYTSFLEEQENTFEITVYGVLFHNEDQDFTYQADNPAGLGTLSNASGYLLFTAFDAVPETIPEETAPAQTVPDVSEEPYPSATETVEETPPATEAEAYSETNRRGSGNKRRQEDPEYFEELTEAVYSRIYLEWMVSNGLFPESELPEDLISDEDLRDWMVYYEEIDADQEFPVPPETEPIQEEPVIVETVPAETLPEVTAPVMISGKPLESYQVNQTDYFNSATGERTTVKYVYLPMPELTVEVYLGPELMNSTAVFTVLHNLRQLRSYFLPMIIACLLMFVLTAVYLCICAGHGTKTAQIRAGGINRMPLDLYLILALSLGGCALALAISGVPILLNSDLTLGCSLAAAAAFLCCLLFVGFCFALAAQIKTGGGFWWRQTLSVRLVLLFARTAKTFSVWFKEKALLGSAKKAGRFSLTSLRWICLRVQKFCFRIGKVMDRFFSLIPLTWQWMVCGIFLLCLILIACNTHSLLLTLICLVAALGIVLYGTHCFGVLLDSTRKMVQGNLETKVDKRLMIGCFWDFAKELNNLADVTNVAAQKQLKSERMKTELITNVSHDIKTPLTSIINYVDLLQNPHTEEEGQA